MVLELDGRGLVALDFGSDAASAAEELKNAGVVPSALRTLSARDNSISLLRGLGQFANLRTLVLANNELSRIDGKQLPRSIRTLDVSGNLLASLDFVLSLPYLADLDVSRNALSTLALRPGARSHALLLRTLNCSQNAIPSLVGIADFFPTLQALDVTENPVAEMDEAGRLPLLEELAAPGGLASLEELRSLTLGAIGIPTDASPVAGMSDAEVTHVLEVLTSSLPSVEAVDGIQLRTRSSPSTAVAVQPTHQHRHGAVDEENDDSVTCREISGADGSDTHPGATPSPQGDDAVGRHNDASADLAPRDEDGDDGDTGEVHTRPTADEDHEEDDAVAGDEEEAVTDAQPPATLGTAAADHSLSPHHSYAEDEEEGKEASSGPVDAVGTTHSPLPDISTAAEAASMSWTSAAAADPVTGLPPRARVRVSGSLSQRSSVSMDDRASEQDVAATNQPSGDAVPRSVAAVAEAVLLSAASFSPQRGARRATADSGDDDDDIEGDGGYSNADSTAIASSISGAVSARSLPSALRSRGRRESQEAAVEPDTSRLASAAAASMPPAGDARSQVASSRLEAMRARVTALEADLFACRARNTDLADTANELEEAVAERRRSVADRTQQLLSIRRKIDETRRDAESLRWKASKRFADVAHAEMAATSVVVRRAKSIERVAAQRSLEERNARRMRRVADASIRQGVQARRRDESHADGSRGAAGARGGTAATGGPRARLQRQLEPTTFRDFLLSDEGAGYVHAAHSGAAAAAGQRQRPAAHDQDSWTEEVTRESVSLIASTAGRERAPSANRRTSDSQGLTAACDGQESAVRDLLIATLSGGSEGSRPRDGGGDVSDVVDGSRSAGVSAAVAAPSMAAPAPRAGGARPTGAKASATAPALQGHRLPRVNQPPSPAARHADPMRS